MRLSLPVLLFVVALSGWSVNQAPANDLGTHAVASSVAADLAQPDLKIDIDVNKGGTERWYANPVWIAIGGIGLVVLLLLVVMASRGGGTTVVKD